MSDLSSFDVVGVDNAEKQVSVNRWNNLLRAIEALLATTTRLAVSRSALAGTAFTTIPAYLTEAGRRGWFYFDSTDRSADVTLDTYQGVYVPPTGQTGSTGAWVRQLETEEVKAEWFGVTYDSSGAASANLAALKSACELIVDVNRPYSRTVLLRGGATCYISGTLEPRAQFHLKGDGYGSYVSNAGTGGASSRLICTDNTATIIIVCGSLTDGETKTLVWAQNAAGSIIEGLGIEHTTQGTYSATAGYGVRLRAPATIRDCVFDKITSDAIHIRASVGGSGADYGNCNDWKACDNDVHSCGGDALHVDGSDTNAGLNVNLLTHGPATTIGGCGIYDNSYIGCTHINPQMTGYGNTGVSHGGNLYRLVSKTAGVGASTTPGTNSAVWWLVSAGAPSATFPAWSGAGTYRLALPIYSDTIASSLFGGYQEGSSVCVWNGKLVSNAFSKIPSGLGDEYFGNVTLGYNAQGGTSTSGKYLWVRNSTGNGLRISTNTTDAYLDNSDGTNFGTDQHYRTGRLHIVYCGSGGGVASVAEIHRTDTNGLALASGKVLKVNSTQVVATRKTGWAVDTGTAKRTANATYAVGSALTVGAAYVQAEHTAIITRQALIEAALQDAMQTIKALKDDLHGTAGHGLIGT